MYFGVPSRYLKLNTGKYYYGCSITVIEIQNEKSVSIEAHFMVGRKLKQIIKEKYKTGIEKTSNNRNY